MSEAIPTNVPIAVQLRKAKDSAYDLWLEKRGEEGQQRRAENQVEYHREKLQRETEEAKIKRRKEWIALWERRAEAAQQRAEAAHEKILELQRWAVQATRAA